MKPIIIASTRESAGKTSLIVGLMSAVQKKYGYIKPFGDRLIYRRKRNWDYDSSLIIDLYGLAEEPESITLGFDHSKLRYVYDEDSLQTTLRTMASTAAAGKDVLLVEGGKDLCYGASLNLDAISVARYLGGSLVVVVAGSNDQILDDVKFLKKFVGMDGLDFAGVIVNKVKDTDEFEDGYLKEIKALGVPILGIVPFKEQLTHFTITYLAEKLYAKVIAGERGMNRVVKNVFVGAMSTHESLRNPLFNKENKFLITSGDRSDMIIAALESDTVGILLTNNILPPPNIIARATEKNVPLLLVTMDTYQATRQIDGMEALLTKENNERMRLLGQLAEKYCRVPGINA